MPPRYTNYINNDEADILMAFLKSDDNIFRTGSREFGLINSKDEDWIVLDTVWEQFASKYHNYEKCLKYNTKYNDDDLFLPIYKFHNFKYGNIDVIVVDSNEFKVWKQATLEMTLITKNRSESIYTNKLLRVAIFTTLKDYFRKSLDSNFPG